MNPSRPEARDATLDNLKGLLIISVVYVHLYDMLGQRTPLLYAIRLTILAVQMPLFLFLSGYFGKHVEKRRSAALSDYLIPFLVFNTLYYLARVQQTPELRYGLLRPLNMYWFLLTLLFIRILMPELVRIRWVLPLSFVLALGIGLDDFFGRTLSLSRTFCFLPFYLMGYYCSRTQMERVRRVPVPVALLTGALGSFLTLCLTDVLAPDKDSSHPFQLVNSYATQGLTPADGIAFRLGLYVIAPLLGVLLLRLCPSRTGLLTRIGRGSMTVYLLHAFPMLAMVGNWDALCALFVRLVPALAGVSYPGRLACGVPQLLALALYACAVSWILSSGPVVRAYDAALAWVRRRLFVPADEHAGVK